MCYKSPGPRCSPHARKAMLSAQAKFLETNKYEDYAAMRKTQKEYDLTPAGQEAIRAAMAKEPDFEKKYALQERLEHAVQSRKLALEEIKAKDQGDINNHDDAKKDTPLPKVPESPLEPSMIRPPTSTTFSARSYMRGVEWDYDSYDCAYGSECDESYCHNNVYSGLRIDSVDEREYLASEFTVNPEDVPEPWVSKLKEFSLKDNVSLEVENELYGEEVTLVRSPELVQFTEELFYSQPNAQDDNKSLNYAREEGLDTTGMRPLEALKETANKDAVPAALRTKLRDAPYHQRTKVAIADIKVMKRAYDKAQSYDFSDLVEPKARSGRGAKRKEQSQSVDGGLLMAVGGGKYQLVGGIERFKAVQATGKEAWDFQIVYGYPSQQHLIV